MPADRVAALEILAKASPNWDKKDPPELQQRHDLMRAKLAGFLDRARRRRAALSDERQEPAGALRPRHRNLPPRRSARCRRPDRRLIQAQPNNPYFHELKGQALLEGGKPAEAIAPLRRAVQLASHPALIQVLLAQAINAANTPSSADEAVKLLRAALAARARVRRRLCPARSGLWAQGRSGAGRSRLGAGRLHARRREDRAPACGPRQDPLPGRIARLGESRRYCRIQARPLLRASDPERTELHATSCTPRPRAPALMLDGSAPAPARRKAFPARSAARSRRSSANI